VLSDKIPAEQRFHLVVIVSMSYCIAAVHSSVEPSDHGTGDSEVLQGAHLVLVSEKRFLLPLLISMAGSIRKKNSCHALRYVC
jgi:hypothetical protein